MDKAPELIRLLQERGPISVKRLSQLTGFSRRAINGALHGSKFTSKIEMSPLSNVSTRPLWSFSTTPERPTIHRKINSRNKNLRKNKDADVVE